MAGDTVHHLETSLAAGRPRALIQLAPPHHACGLRDRTREGWRHREVAGGQAAPSLMCITYVGSLM